MNDDDGDDFDPLPPPEVPEVLRGPGRSPHIRLLPSTIDDIPGDDGGSRFPATEKQARFKETAVACVADGQTTFPAWRLAHHRRCNERVTAPEWEAWGAQAGFTAWFTEDIAWTPTPVDAAMADGLFHVAVAEKLRAGKDTKALEIYAKMTRRIGNDADTRGGGLTILLNWARGHGARSDEPPPDAMQITVDDDPWGAARPDGTR